MTEHTPGPWNSIEVPNERRPLVTHGDLPIARIHPAQGKMEANARLIAAAPDLLEALTNLVSVFDGRQAHYMPLMPPDAPRQFEIFVPEFLVEAGRAVLNATL